jgi:hypothetical protein
MTTTPSTRPCSATHPTYESVSTDKLKVGDIVHRHGMITLLDSEPRTYESNDRTVYSFSGLVLNAEEMREIDAFIWRHLHEDVWVEGKGWVWTFTGRWTIQGNHFATWAREVRA